MELRKTSSTHTTMLMGLALTLLILIPVSPANAVDYMVTENFSDPTDLSWTFRGMDWTDTNIPDEVDHHLAVNNGTLVSEGDLDYNVHNLAHIRNPTQLGAWRFEVYSPQETLSERDTFTHLAWLSEEALNASGGVPSNGYMIWFAEDYIKISQVVLSGELPLNVSYYQNDFMFYDAWTDVDLIKTDDQLIIALNGEYFSSAVINASKFEDMEYFTLIALHGTLTRFDNLRITSDYVGVLDELNIDPSTLTLPPDTTDNSALIAGYAMIGIGLSTAAVFAGRTYAKKNDSKS